MTDAAPTGEPASPAPRWRLLVRAVAAVVCVAVTAYGALRMVQLGLDDNSQMLMRQGRRIAAVGAAGLVVIAVAWRVPRRGHPATSLLSAAVAVAAVTYATTARTQTLGPVQDELAALEALRLPDGAKVEVTRTSPAEQLARRAWSVPGGKDAHCPDVKRSLEEWAGGVAARPVSKPDDSEECSWRATRGAYEGFLALQVRDGMPLQLVFEVTGE